MSSSVRSRAMCVGVLLAAAQAHGVEVGSYGKVWFDGASVVVENDSGDFVATLRGRTFQLDFREDMRGAVVTTGASVPFIDAPYISVEVVGASDSDPNRLEIGLIRNGGQGRLLQQGFGFWFMVIQSGNAGDDSRAAAVKPSSFRNQIDLGKAYRDSKDSKETRSEAYIELRNETHDLREITFAVSNWRHTQNWQVQHGVPFKLSGLPAVGFAVGAFNPGHPRRRAIGGDYFQLAVPFEISVTGTGGDYKLEVKPLE